MLFFSVYGCMLCLVCYLFVISTSVIDCLGRFVPEMTYYVLSGTLNLTKLNSNSLGSALLTLIFDFFCTFSIRKLPYLENCFSDFAVNLHSKVLVGLVSLCMGEFMFVGKQLLLSET